MRAINRNRTGKCFVLFLGGECLADFVPYDEDRRRIGQQDATETLEETGAVEHRGLISLVGNAF